MVLQLRGMGFQVNLHAFHSKITHIATFPWTPRRSFFFFFCSCFRQETRVFPLRTSVPSGPSAARRRSRPSPPSACGGGTWARPRGRTPPRRFPGRTQTKSVCGAWTTLIFRTQTVYFSIFSFIQVDFYWKNKQGSGLNIFLSLQVFHLWSLLEKRWNTCNNKNKSSWTKVCEYLKYIANCICCAPVGGADLNVGLDHVCRLRDQRRHDARHHPTAEVCQRGVGRCRHLCGKQEKGGG